MASKRELIARRDWILREGCPTIFAGDDDFPFECREGWYPLIATLLDALERIATDSQPGLRVVQIKEKFGGLRVYIEGAAEFDEDGKSTEVGALIRGACQDALHVCEFCGEDGELRKDLPWIRTLCEIDYLRERIRFLERDLSVARSSTKDYCRVCSHEVMETTARHRDEARAEAARWRTRALGAEGAPVGAESGEPFSWERAPQEYLPGVAKPTNPRLDHPWPESDD